VRLGPRPCRCKPQGTAQPAALLQRLRATQTVDPRTPAAITTSARQLTLYRPKSRATAASCGLVIATRAARLRRRRHPHRHPRSQLSVGWASASLHSSRSTILTQQPSRLAPAPVERCARALSFASQLDTSLLQPACTDSVMHEFTVSPGHPRHVLSVRNTGTFPPLSALLPNELTRQTLD
jgi:hypothetical protein